MNNAESIIELSKRFHFATKLSYCSPITLLCLFAGLFILRELAPLQPFAKQLVLEHIRSCDYNQITVHFCSSVCYHSHDYLGTPKPTETDFLLSLAP
jgi:hypothetical protein